MLRLAALLPLLTGACVYISCCLQSTVTRLAALPGGRLLASADEDGHLVATDVRSLGTGLAGVALHRHASAAMNSEV